MDINLWNPAYEGIYASILISYLLGIVHGITPDEHTWPITFSYAVGNYSTKGGAKAGLIFSSGFTLQRALMSELATFALAGFMLVSYFNGLIYIIVGSVMALSGFYIANKLRYPHIHYFEEKLYGLFGIHKGHEEKEKMEMEHMANPVMVSENGQYKPVPNRLAFVHGLIAGFGFGAFALIIYFVIAPEMPVYLGFLPGLMFGLGTMTMQVLAGTMFGMWLSKKKDLTVKGIAYVARGISSYVLSYGGLAFVVAGVLAIAFPVVWNYNIITGIKIHNLDALGLPFFIVVFVVVILGYVGYRVNVKKAIRMGYTNRSENQRPLEYNVKN